MKTLLRILALFSLAIAVIAAVLDVTRSIADSSVVFTPLGLDWYNFAPSSLNQAQNIIQELVHPVIWDPIIQTILLAPSWAVFTILWMIFSLLGSRKKAKWQDNYQD